MNDKYIYTRVPSDDMMSEAAEFFSEHYGIWGESAVKNMGSSIKAGNRVKISPTKLKEELLPEGFNNIFIRVVREDRILGMLFATRWRYQHQDVFWVTLLCVHREHRLRGIAKNLLRMLKADQMFQNYSVGILSSHPFSIAAVASVFGNRLRNIDLGYIRTEAKEMMASCPVTYVREAKLRGTLFEDNPAVDGAISCADTQFWVDHGVTEIALFAIKKKYNTVWPLGTLPEGHEYLLLMKVNDTRKEEIKGKEPAKRGVGRPRKEKTGSSSKTAAGVKKK